MTNPSLSYVYKKFTEKFAASDNPRDIVRFAKKTFSFDLKYSTVQKYLQNRKKLDERICEPLNSETGEQLLNETIQHSSHYQKWLIDCFFKQKHSTTAGLVTLTIILNAKLLSNYYLSNDDEDIDDDQNDSSEFDSDDEQDIETVKEQLPWMDELQMIDIFPQYSTILISGMTLNQMAHIFLDFGTRSVRVVHIEYSSKDLIEEFRNECKTIFTENHMSIDKVIVCNMGLWELQTNISGGSIATIAAYHENTDRLLLLNTRTEPNWVKLESLYNSMFTLNDENYGNRKYSKKNISNISNTYRGYIVCEGVSVWGNCQTIEEKGDIDSELAVVVVNNKNELLIDGIFDDNIEIDTNSNTSTNISTSSPPSYGVSPQHKHRYQHSHKRTNSILNICLDNSNLLLIEDENMEEIENRRSSKYFLNRIAEKNGENVGKKRISSFFHSRYQLKNSRSSKRYFKKLQKKANNTQLNQERVFIDFESNKGQIYWKECLATSLYHQKYMVVEYFQQKRQTVPGLVSICIAFNAKLLAYHTTKEPTEQSTIEEKHNVLYIYGNSSLNENVDESEDEDEIYDDTIQRMTENKMIDFYASCVHGKNSNAMVNGVFAVPKLSDILTKGMNLSELAECLKMFGCKSVEIVHTYQMNIERFRDLIKLLLSSSHSDNDQVLIVNYDLYKLGTGLAVGHMSPIGAFHEKSDMVLLLDVFWMIDKCWVSLAVLYEAMNSIDDECGKYRGCVIGKGLPIIKF